MAPKDNADMQAAFVEFLQNASAAEKLKMLGTVKEFAAEAEAEAEAIRAEYKTRLDANGERAKESAEFYREAIAALRAERDAVLAEITGERDDIYAEARKNGVEIARRGRKPQNA